MEIERIDITYTDYGEVVGVTQRIDINEADEIGDDYIIYKGKRYECLLGEPPIINEKLLQDLRAKYNEN
jgi:hypothetical protein